MISKDRDTPVSNAAVSFFGFHKQGKGCIASHVTPSSTHPKTNDNKQAARHNAKQLKKRRTTTNLSFTIQNLSAAKRLTRSSSREKYKPTSETIPSSNPRFHFPPSLLVYSVSKTMVVRRSQIKKKKNSDLAGVGSMSDLNFTHVVASNKTEKHGHGGQQQKQGQASSQESSGKTDVGHVGFELAERKRSEVAQLLYVDMQQDSAYEVATAMLKLSDLMSEKLQAKKEEEKGDDDTHDSYWDSSDDEDDDNANNKPAKKPPVNLGKQNKKLVFALGGHALILVKMSEYLQDEYVQLYGLKCLKMLCYNGYDDADVAIIQASGIEQIMDSMKAHSRAKSSQVQICGLTALINLFKKIGFTPLQDEIQNTTNPDEKEEKDKGMELIHSAIRRFMYVELNGTEFVLSTMKNYADDEKLQGYSIWLINIMLAAELDKLSEEVFNPSAAKKREYLQTTKFMDCVGMIGDAIKNHRENDNNVKVQGAQFMKSLFGSG